MFIATLYLLVGLVFSVGGLGYGIRVNYMDIRNDLDEIKEENGEGFCKGFILVAFVFVTLCWPFLLIRHVVKKQIVT